MATAPIALSGLIVLELCIPDGPNVIITAVATLASSCPHHLYELNAQAEHDPDHDSDRPDPLKELPLTPPLVRLTLTGFLMSPTMYATFLLKATRLRTLSLTPCKKVGAMPKPLPFIPLQSLQCLDCQTGPVNDFWELGLTSRNGLQRPFPVILLMVPNLKLHQLVASDIANHSPRQSDVSEDVKPGTKLSEVVYWPSVTVETLERLEVY
eukprot:SM000219S06696  [mRNA]  locus=s219:130286:131496:+ [translate_table: standard]